MAEKERENIEALDNNNLINAKDMTTEKRKRIENNRSGSTNITELQDEFDMREVFRQAMQNSLYANMEEPCKMSGIDLNQRLVEFFTKEVTSMTNLAESVQKAMMSIKDDINKHDPYLVFDNSGSIDPNAIAEKAKGRELPDYLERYIDKFTLTRNTVDTKENSSEQGKKFWEELNDRYSTSLEPFMAIYRDKIASWFEKANMVDFGKGPMIIDVNISVEENIARNVVINVMETINEFADTNVVKTMEERDALAEKMIAYYAYFVDPEAIEKVSPEMQEIFEALKGNIAEDLYNQLGLRIDDISSLEEFCKRVGKKPEQLLDYKNNAAYKDISQMVVQIKTGQITLEDIKKDREKHDFIKIMGLIQESGVMNSDIKSVNTILATRARNHDEALSEFVSEQYPEYYEEAKNNRNIDEYSTFRFRALRELKVRERLKESLMQRRNDGKEVGQIDDKEYVSVKMAAAVLKLDDVDVETKKLALTYLQNTVPNLKLTRTTRDAVLKGTDDKKVEAFLDNVQREAMFVVEQGANAKEILTGLDFAYDGLIYLEDSVKQDLFERLTVPDINDGKNALGLTEKQNAEYEALFESKIDRYNEELYNVKYMSYIYKAIQKNATVLDEKKGSLTKEEEVRFVKELVLAAKMADKMGDKRLQNVVSEYLVDFLPDAFDKSGTIDLIGLDDKFDLYLSDRDYEDEDLSEINKYLENEIHTAVQQEINQTKIEMNMTQILEDAKNELSNTMHAEKNLQNIEDIIRFLNYIQRKSDKLPDESRQELEDWIGKSKENLEPLHERILKNASKRGVGLIGEHENFDENVEKDKFSYLETQARKLIAGKRIRETKEDVLGKGKEFDENRRMGVIGSYLALRNDYKLAELDSEEYKQILIDTAELMKVMNPELIGEDGKIDDDKVLEEYNKLFGKSYEDIDEVARIEEQETLMRYARRLTKEIVEGKGKKGYVSLLTSDNLYIAAKIEESLKKDVHLREEETNKLINDVWSNISGEKEVKSEKDEIELVSNLALVYGVFKNDGGKDPEKLSYEARKIYDLERKTFGIAQNRLYEMFPEALDGDVKIQGALENQIVEYLCEKRPEIRKRIESGENIYKVLQEERKKEDKKTRKTKKSKKEEEKTLSTDELLEKANEVLKGTKKEKTDEDKAIGFELMRMISASHANSSNINQITRKLIKNYTDEELKYLSQQQTQPKISDMQLRYMKRVAGISRMESYINRDESVPLLPKKKSDALIDAYGTILTCKELPEDIISESAVFMAKKIIKELAPGAITANGEINKSKLSSKIVSYRLDNPVLRDIQIPEESLDGYVSDKLEFKLAAAYAGERLDSRFNDITYMPTYINAKEDITFIMEKFKHSMGKQNDSFEYLKEIKYSKPSYTLPVVKLGTAKNFKMVSRTRPIKDNEIGSAFEKLGVDIPEVEEEKIEQDVNDRTTYDNNRPEVVEEFVKETYEEKVDQATANTMQAEEILVEHAVESEVEHAADSHPAVIEKKSIFRKALEKVSSVIKNIVNKVSGNGETSTSGNATSTTSNAGNDKNSSVVEKNDLGIEIVALDVKAAQKSAAESQTKPREETEQEK